MYRICCYLAVLVIIVFNFSCTSSKDKTYLFPVTPDYAKSEMWYRTPTGEEDKAVDVFYVTPTCIWDWQTDTGDVIHYMDVTDSVQRAAVDGSNWLAYSLFAEACNFYSPYYRQISMNSWFEPIDEIERRYRYAHEDVVRAFQYYMEHLNQGRPFILAGHSQGAKAVIELLKYTLNAEQYGRMVAAYAFGFSVSQEEVVASPFLKPAKGAADCGVVICYNSVSHEQAASPLFQANTLCINPINWKTDTTYASALENLGSVFFDAEGKSDTLFHAVGVRVLPNRHLLLIDGLSDDDYYIPSIAKLFPKGNYHVQELNLYFLNLQQNIAQRIATFFEGRE